MIINRLKHFIVISITIFMMVDIGLKLSILDTLDKKRIASAEQEKLAYAKSSNGTAKKSIYSAKNAVSKSSFGTNQKGVVKTVSTKSSFRDQTFTKKRAN